MAADISLSVDPEFRDLIPPMADDEKAMLREAIKRDGCRDPIVYWDTGNPIDGNLIIDGHNRHDLCGELGASFKTKKMEFADRHAVRVWILQNQLGRRNLTDAQRSLARGRLYNETKGTRGGHTEHTKTGEHYTAKGQNVTLPSLQGTSVASEIAKHDGVSTRTVKRDGKLAEAVDALKARSPELANAVLAGALPLNAAQPLVEATKTELRQLAKLEGTELRKAAKAVIEADKPESPPEPESDEDGPSAVVLNAITTGKMKASDDQLATLAKMEEEDQDAIVQAVVNGRQSLRQAIDEGPAPPGPEEVGKELSAKYDAALREVARIINALRSENDPWIDDKWALIEGDLRSLRNTIYSCKAIYMCPACGGTGCKTCHKTGRVTKYEKDKAA